MAFTTKPSLRQTLAGSSVFCSTQPPGSRSSYFFLSSVSVALTYIAKWLIRKVMVFRLYEYTGSQVPCAVVEAALGLLWAGSRTIQCWSVAPTFWMLLPANITDLPIYLLLSSLNILCVLSVLFLFITRSVLLYHRLQSYSLFWPCGRTSSLQSETFCTPGNLTIMEMLKENAHNLRIGNVQEKPEYTRLK